MAYVDHTTITIQADADGNCELVLDDLQLNIVEVQLMASDSCLLDKSSMEVPIISLVYTPLRFRTYNGYYMRGKYSFNFPAGLGKVVAVIHYMQQ